VMAFPFDLRSHRARGRPVPVLSGVRLESIWGAGQLAVTRDGTLIYARGENGRLNTLVWRDDRGHVDTLNAFGRGDYGYMDLSADGLRLLIRVCTSQGTCAPQALSLREGVRVSLPEYITSLTTGALGWWDRGQKVYDHRYPLRSRRLVVRRARRGRVDVVRRATWLSASRARRMGSSTSERR
jgi:hypothetical protein